MVASAAACNACIRVTAPQPAAPPQQRAAPLAADGEDTRVRLWFRDVAQDVAGRAGDEGADANVATAGTCAARARGACGTRGRCARRSPAQRAKGLTWSRAGSPAVAKTPSRSLEIERCGAAGWRAVGQRESLAFRTVSAAAVTSDSLG